MKNILIITNILLALLIATALFLGLRQLGHLRQSYADLHTATLDLQAEAETTRLLSETVEARDTLSAAIVTAESLPTFIEELESLARETSTKLDLASASEPSNADPNIKLDFRLNGTYQALTQFTLLLDTLPYQLRVQEIEFNREGIPENKKNSPTWRAHFGLELLNSQIKK